MRNEHRGRGFGRPGGWQQADLPDPADVPDWFAGRLPSDWFVGKPVIEVDRDEIVVIGELPLPKPERADGEDTEAPTEKIPTATKEGAIARFRESTRPARMQIAGEAQHRYARNVAWGVSVDGERIMFTQLAVPVMTRLRQPERKVLDTLVDSGVARSRSDALAWTVKLAGKHAEAWLEELRTAMRKVDDLRSEGPKGL
ncbi:hypothetical protein APR12_004751 [Nocardia amikacinitolerans]|uniref:hypothetical protein n=1 Tax=Nocardia amikacinitolerans TaxID=756689 RepID=UPI00082DEF21|nr:hypothetical protein [Nocardia amikacinitolerans]MCP2319383.1 hypothetical protein [Nocardia amikacinitolerans]